VKPFAIAGMQLALSHRGDNIARIRERLAFLMHVFPWIEMVVFSELAACGPLTTRAEPLPGPTEEAFRQLATDHRIWLVNGSHFEAAGGKVYNTASVIDPNGVVVGRHRKMFPFVPYEIGVAAGDEFLVFDVPDVGRFGVSICYDMWFPETSRCLVAMGAEVLIHPTMTSTIDRDVELAMARATAAQNQCFVIDVNGAGDLGNGRSVFVDPAGAVLYEAGRHEEIIPIEIDLERVHRSREIGLRGLGQPLKSFRDANVRFPVYEPGGRDALASLGPLVRPSRTVRTGTSAPAGGAIPPPAQGE
jgi:predicted amidohydrolase